VDQGSSYLLAESLAAILLGQLEDFNSIQFNRSQIVSNYIEGLDNTFLRVNQAHIESSDVAHMFYLETKDQEYRSQLMNFLLDQKYHATTHYQPLHSSVAGKMFGGGKLDHSSNSEHFAQHILRLPLWIGLSDEAQYDICQAINNFKVVTK
jgi:dTDP-4-amino-4,6-dideoxygalactose transaminase